MFSTLKFVWVKKNKNKNGCNKHGSVTDTFQNMLKNMATQHLNINTLSLYALQVCLLSRTQREMISEVKIAEIQR